jgi:DNA-binding NarL/FixJ family response regulator
VIRVLVCDDHQIVREGIRQILADASDIALAGEAANGADALARTRAGGIDVVLLDIAMPQRDGLDVLKQLRAELPALPVLVLSTYPDRQYAVRCLKLGAAGYLNKSADSEQLAPRAADFSSRRQWPSCSPARSASPRRRCTSACRTANTRCSNSSRQAAASARSPRRCTSRPTR